VHRTQDSTALVLVGAAASAVALLAAWRWQDRLRLVPVLSLALLVPLAWLALHHALDVMGDKDSSIVFRWQGNGLLRGDYPRSEYPAGAVVLFALEAWLGSNSTRTTNALLMAPLNALVVGCVWLTRAPLAPWLAAFVGLWPLNAFYWQYKFDLAPAALLLLGLLLAYRGRWALGGVALGLGAAVKWTPAFAVLALAAWLLSTRRRREALAHVGAAVAAFVLVHAPFVLAAPDDALAAYSRQSGRAITPESLWYLLLRPLDLAHVRTHISFGAGAPRRRGRCAREDPRGRRRGGRARPSRLPDRQPHLQPAVRARPLRRLGIRRGARAPNASRAARGRCCDGARGRGQRVRLPVRAAVLRLHVADRVARPVHARGRLDGGAAREERERRRSRDGKEVGQLVTSAVRRLRQRGDDDPRDERGGGRERVPRVERRAR
jgi:hypothetical protein